MTSSEAQLLLFAICHDYDQHDHQSSQAENAVARDAAHVPFPCGLGLGGGVGLGVGGAGQGLVGDGDDEETMMEVGANKAKRGASATKVCSVS
jgi:hypothetical protein